MRKFLAFSLLVSTLSFMSLPLQAAMLSTQQLIQSSSSSIERDKLVSFTQRQDVQGQLLSMGLNPNDVQMRVAAMTDAEVAQLNHNMQTLPAGGDVLGLVALIFIVFVVTDAVGATDVFPFVHPIK